MDTAKVFGALLLVLSVVLILRELKVRAAVLFTAGAVVFFLSLSVTELLRVFELFYTYSVDGPFSKYIGVLIKALGIGLCTGMLAEFCRDLGEGTLSRVTELCGKTAILLLALPLLTDFLELLVQSAAFAK